MALELQSTKKQKPTTQHGGGVHLWLQWLLAVSLGELLSFGAPALTGVTLSNELGTSNSILAGLLLVGAMMLAGSVEGVVLGYAQWLVLHRVLREMAWWKWVGATVVVAVVGWGIGMAIFTFFVPFATSSGASEGPSTVLQVVMGAMLGFGLGIMMGLAQWIVLRQYVRRAGWWILISALGWAGGMAVIFAGMNVIPDSASTALIVMMSVASAVAMGATFAAITGIGLIWLLRDKLV